MPTYEYECSKCQQQFEIVQSISDSTLTTCPKDKCRMAKWGKGKVKRMISAGAGLIFKGTGFYITDYRSENYKEGAKKDSTAASSAASAEHKASPAGGGDSKTPKADPKPAAPAKSTGSSKGSKT